MIEESDDIVFFAGHIDWNTKSVYKIYFSKKRRKCALYKDDKIIINYKHNLLLFKHIGREIWIIGFDVEGTLMAMRLGVDKELQHCELTLENR